MILMAEKHWHTPLVVKILGQTQIRRCRQSLSPPKPNACCFFASHPHHNRGVLRLPRSGYRIKSNRCINSAARLRLSGFIAWPPWSPIVSGLIARVDSVNSIERPKLHAAHDRTTTYFSFVSVPSLWSAGRQLALAAVILHILKPYPLEVHNSGCFVPLLNEVPRITLNTS